MSRRRMRVYCKYIVVKYPNLQATKDMKKVKEKESHDPLSAGLFESASSSRDETDKRYKVISDAV